MTASAPESFDRLIGLAAAGQALPADLDPAEREDLRLAALLAGLRKPAVAPTRPPWLDRPARRRFALPWLKGAWPAMAPALLAGLTLLLLAGWMGIVRLDRDGAATSPRPDGPVAPAIQASPTPTTPGHGAPWGAASGGERPSDGGAPDPGDGPGKPGGTVGRPDPRQPAPPTATPRRQRPAPTEAPAEPTLEPAPASPEPRRPDPTAEDDEPPSAAPDYLATVAPTEHPEHPHPSPTGHHGPAPTATPPHGPVPPSHPTPTLHAPPVLPTASPHPTQAPTVDPHLTQQPVHPTVVPTDPHQPTDPPPHGTATP